ncbi:MAG: hypothetical protein JNK82_43855 [Myxococcaceae bacterium]|nr:hypothetical protein [Myxococcaceae bacterium]
MHHVALTMPEFRHLQPEHILVVAGEARRASRGTVKPLAFAKGKRRDAFGRKKPLIKLHGVRMLYCITLRPLFFRASTPRTRVATLLHELFHISRKFDGTLDRARRHSRLGPKFDARFNPLEKRLWQTLPDLLREPFEHDGEVKVLQWLERPTAWLPGERSSGRRLYTQAHLFQGVMRMKGRRSKSKVARSTPPT